MHDRAPDTRGSHVVVNKLRKRYESRSIARILVKILFVCARVLLLRNAREEEGGGGEGEGIELVTP